MKKLFKTVNEQVPFRIKLPAKKKSSVPFQSGTGEISFNFTSHLSKFAY